MVLYVVLIYAVVEKWLAVALLLCRYGTAHAAVNIISRPVSYTRRGVESSGKEEGK